MKSFFKPTKSKVALFILLIVLASFIPDTDTACAPDAEPEQCSEIRIKGVGYPTFYGEGYENDTLINGIIYPASFLVNLIVYYLLASSIAHFYKRWRRQ